MASLTFVITKRYGKYTTFGIDDVPSFLRIRMNGRIRSTTTTCNMRMKSDQVVANWLCYKNKFLSRAKAQGYTNNNRRCIRTITTDRDEKPLLDPNIEHYLLTLNLLNDGHNGSILQGMTAQKIHVKIVQSLEAVYGKGKVKVSHLQSFGKEGLKALTTSILWEESTSTIPYNPPTEDTAMKNPFVTVRISVPHHKTEFDLPWYYTTIHADNVTSSLLDVRTASVDGSSLLSEYIEASCGGNCSCATCHVYIEPTTATTMESTTDPTKSILLSNITEAEMDMLDLAYQPNDISRLSCQVRLKQVPTHLVGSKEPALIVIIPSGVNDFWK
jgi:ferredoxin